MSVLANDQAIKWTKAKVCVFADSVLCVGQMKDTPGAIERWKGQVEGLRLYSSYQDAVGIDGEAIEFEWKIFTGFSSLSILQEIQHDLGRRNIQPEEFKDRIIFVSMLMTQSGKRMMRIVFRMPNKSRITKWDSRKDIGHSWVQGRRKGSGMALLLTLKKGKGIVQPTKWSNGSKKLVILFSKAPVPWVVESWSKRMVKVPFSSTEIPWTQNSCSKQFTLSICSVFKGQ